MGMVAILVTWPGQFEQTFVPPSHGDSIWNLASIGQWFLRRCVKSVEDGWTDDEQMIEAYLSYKFTNETSAQVS